MSNEQTLYDLVDGMDTFRRIVAGFYQQVREDDLIGPMYPQDDWDGAEERLLLFLVQYWGGPRTYSQQRGHPRLRMRHHQFPIGAPAAQRWLELMDNSIATIDEETLPTPARAALRQHMEQVAYMLINRHSIGYDTTNGNPAL